MVLPLLFLISVAPLIHLTFVLCNQLDTIHVFYKAPCRNCNLVYIGDARGETGKKFGTRLEEDKSGVKKVSSKRVTRAGREESITNTYKSAITDHVADWNHVIGWEKAKFIGTEEDYKRWIKEAIEIRKRRERS